MPNNWRNFNSYRPGTYYFDPLAGNDAHAGTTPATAWQTQAKAEQTTLTVGQSILKKIDGDWIVFRIYSATPTNGYVVGYYEDNGPRTIPLTDINWGALTHLYHDHVEPNSDGTLDFSLYNITPARSTAVINAAHAAGVKCSIVIADIYGHAGVHGFVPSATTYCETFVSNLVNFVISRGYDGLDIDWETGMYSDIYKAFMAKLYPALKSRNPQLTVTNAVGAGAGSYAFIAALPYSDGFGVMCYGAYLTGSRVTWFNNPLHDGNLYGVWGLNESSTERMMNTYLRLGAPKSKLLAGLSYYANVYSGALGTDGSASNGPLRPRQSYTRNWADEIYMGYCQVMTGLPVQTGIDSGGFYSAVNDHWDTESQTPYLSLPNADPTLNRYLSYDDPASITAKVLWGIKKGLNGISIWEIGCDYIPSRPLYKEPLAEAVRTSFRPVHLIPPSSAPSVPSGLVASAISASSVTLHWPVVANARAYNLKRSSTSGSGYVTLATLSAPGYTDATVAANATYYYVLSSISYGVESANSAQISVTATALPAPTNLLTSPGDLTNAAWTVNATAGAAIVGAQSFTTNATGVTSLTQLVAVAANTAYFATVTGTLASGSAWGTFNVYGSDYGGLNSIGHALVAGTVWTYQVAFNSGAYTAIFFDFDLPDGNPNLTVTIGSASIVASVGVYLPATPSGLAITAPVAINTFNLFAATLSWLWSAGATSYNVYRSAGDGGANLTLLASSPVASYTDLTLSPNSSFYYRVSAVYGIAESLLSSPVSVATPVNYAPPNALASPSAINVAPWTVSGSGASAIDAVTIQCASSGDTFLAQSGLFVAAATDYTFIGTLLLPSAGAWVLISVYDQTYATMLASIGQWATAATPLNFALNFNTGAFSEILVVVDIGAQGASFTAIVTNASVAVNLPQIQPNVLVSTGDIRTASWIPTTGLAFIDATHFLAGSLSTGTGVSQSPIPCTANTDYIATVTVLREGTAYVSGTGGFAVFTVGDSGFTNGMGLMVLALTPSSPNDMYLLFNSGSFTRLNFSLTVTAEAVGGSISLTNISLRQNPYAHADQ